MRELPPAPQVPDKWLCCQFDLRNTLLEWKSEREREKEGKKERKKEKEGKKSEERERGREVTEIRWEVCGGAERTAQEKTNI